MVGDRVLARAGPVPGADRVQQARPEPADRIRVMPEVRAGAARLREVPVTGGDVVEREHRGGVGPHDGPHLVGLVHGDQLEVGGESLQEAPGLPDALIVGGVHAPTLIPSSRPSAT
jgi:hypothetical protein